MRFGGTFKLVKGQLRNEAYRLNQVNNVPLYVMKPRQTKYQVRDDVFYQLPNEGEAGF